MLIVYFMENLVDFVKIVLKGNILWTQIIRFGFLFYTYFYKILELMDLFIQEQLYSLTRKWILWIKAV